MKKNDIDYSKKILEVKNLRQYFKVGSGKNKLIVKAVDGISFDVYKREVFGLVGESGCGKTTTGRSIIKLYNQTDGKVIYNGNVIGAGYESHLYDIKKLKKQAELETIKNMPAKYKKYLIQESFNKKIEEFKQEKFYNKLECDKKVSEKNKPILDYKEKFIGLKNELNHELSDLKHQFNLKTNELISKSIESILSNRKANLNLIKKRAVDKINFIKQAKLSQFEKNEQIRIIEDTRKKEIEYIEEKAKNSIIKNLKLNENDYTSLKEIKKLYVGSERKENKKTILEYKDEYKKDRLSIIESFKFRILKYKENKLNVSEIKKEISNIKLFSKDKNYIINLKVHKLKEEMKIQLNELKMSLKNDESSFINNSDEIFKIKNELKKEIEIKKTLIKEAKRENKLIESSDKKIERLKEKAQEKKDFILKKKELENIDDVNLKKEKMSILKKEHKEKLEEISRKKPSHSNFVSTMQMIFQDPISSLNPRMIVSDIISEGLRIKGMKNKKEIQKRVFELLNLVGLNREHASRYPHEFSGGQRQRIGIARALIVNPDFIIADEPISALDVSIQAQVINLLNELKEKLGLTILFVAHDLSVVKYFSDRIAVMFFGKIVELASSEELFKNPLHPYTKSLLSAIPHPDPILEKNRTRIIYDPKVHDYTIEKPELREISKGHFISANNIEYEKYLKELKGDVN